MSRRWTAADVPAQSGRVAVVTGGNAGLGFETAAVLADKGMHVVLAVRDTEKGRRAAARIADRSPHADVSVQQLDLASQASVRAAADALKHDHERIDVLINNAGALVLHRRCTVDGFELHFGTNHLGHFALTGLLLDRLLPTTGSRVVVVSSLGHRIGARIDFDDLHWERNYRAAAAYGGSKLANLMFAYELQRRLSRTGATTIAVAAHPGGARTELVRELPGPQRLVASAWTTVAFQSPAMGALPALRAATDPSVRGGEFFGPRGLGQQRGYPTRVESSRRSHDTVAQCRLWEVSERLTGVHYQV